MPAISIARWQLKRGETKERGKGSVMDVWPIDNCYAFADWWSFTIDTTRKHSLGGRGSRLHMPPTFGIAYENSTNGWKREYEKKIKQIN